MNRRTILVAGALASAGFATLWHGPLGAGERLALQAETSARATLVKYELPMIQAKMQRDPLSRRLILSGPADNFQRSELMRILDQTPGVLEVRWDPDSLPQESRVVP
jgi:hypothetical protein